MILFPTWVKGDISTGLFYMIRAWTLKRKCIYVKSKNREKWDVFLLFETLLFPEMGKKITNSKEICTVYWYGAIAKRAVH